MSRWRSASEYGPASRPWTRESRTAGALSWRFVSPRLRSLVCVCLHRALQHEGGEEILRHGFLQKAPTVYEYHTLPDWTVDDFVTSWGMHRAAGASARI